MKAFRTASLATLTLLALPAISRAWSHQGHIIITRLAAHRILTDPAAPQGLKDFLSKNIAPTPDNIKSLALTEKLGIEPPEPYLNGLDGAVTLPDRIQYMPGGKDPIPPYNARELLMHFVDLEYLTPAGKYNDDLTGRPDMSAVPRDVKDPRYQRAGYAPFRIEECYTNLVAELAKGPAMNNQNAVRWAAYLAHYVEDLHQPHHTTADHKSISYLAGHVPGVPASAADQPTESVRLPQGINPHGDVEFQLFEDTNQPRATLRQTYWTNLNKHLQELAPTPLTSDPANSFDPWSAAVGTMYDSYDHLPLIGRAARAAYTGTGKFDPQTFFTYTWSIHGQKLSVIDMIALQNAKAALAVEKVWRQAWTDAQARAGKK